MSPPGTSLDPVTMRPPVEMAAPRSAWALCLLAAIGLLAAVIRFRLLEIPLDRDEGEYRVLRPAPARGGAALRRCLQPQGPRRLRRLCPDPRRVRPDDRGDPRGPHHRHLGHDGVDVSLCRTPRRAPPRARRRRRLRRARAEPQ